MKDMIPGKQGIFGTKVARGKADTVWTINEWKLRNETIMLLFKKPLKYVWLLGYSIVSVFGAYTENRAKFNIAIAWKIGNIL